MGIPLPGALPFGRLNHNYGYANQNPMTYTDPTGEFFVPGAVIGGFIGGITAALTADPSLSNRQLAGTILSGALSGAFSGALPFGSVLANATIGAGAAATGFIGSSFSTGSVDPGVGATQIALSAAGGAITGRVGFGIAHNLVRSSSSSRAALNAGGVFGTAIGATTAGAALTFAPRSLGGAGAASSSSANSCGCRP